MTMNYHKSNFILNKDTLQKFCLIFTINRVQYISGDSYIVILLTY